MERKILFLLLLLLLLRLLIQSNHHSDSDRIINHIDIDEKELKWKTTVDYYLLYIDVARDIYIYSLFMLNHFNNNGNSKCTSNKSENFLFSVESWRTGGMGGGLSPFGRRVIKIKQQKLTCTIKINNSSAWEKHIFAVIRKVAPFVSLVCRFLMMPNFV